MTYHTRRLINHNQVIIFKNDFKWDIFGLGLDWWRGRHFDIDNFSGFDLMRGLKRFAVAADITSSRQLGEMAAGIPLDFMAAENIEPVPGLILGNDDF